MSKSINRTALIVTSSVLAVVLIIAVAVAIGVTCRRIRKNTRPENLPLTDLTSARHERRVPATRVASLPPGVHRVTVSNHPVVDVLEGFLTAAEADHLVSIADNRFAPSIVIDTATGKRVPNKDRTSSSVFLDRAEDPVVKRIEARAAAVAGLPASHLERLQVVRYNPGQFYKAHYDYLHGATDEVRKNGQRTVTIFVYLNDLPADEPGGGTKFPHLDTVIRPLKGKAALWHNVTPSGHPDPRTLHAGQPVEKSTKYGANIWFRDRPQ